VVAIAAVDDADQVRLVSRVAEVFLDDAAVSRIEATDDPGDVVAAFAPRVR
jgi:mannitol/fructose-specific phosphotransferase system IIA component